MIGVDGVARVKIADEQISLNGLYSIIGRAVVVHAGRDDLGKVSNDEYSSLVMMRMMRRWRKRRMKMRSMMMIMAEYSR